MIRAFTMIMVLLLSAAPGLEARDGSAFRVALIGPGRAQAEGGPLNNLSPEAALRAALGRDARVAVLDQSRLQPALAGLGYDGSINLSKEEARRIGAAIGCDFFITGKAEVVTRSERENQSHEEAIAGVMIVDGRSGALAAFDFLAEKVETKEAALALVARALGSRASSYVAEMAQFRSSRERVLSSSATAEQVEDLPAEGSAQSSGFTPPEFLNRVKPEYTAEADRADITATVEAAAVFKSNGQVGEVEILRWAGFGLDESSERAIRQLRFKPATRSGKPVSVRAFVRYNFRRVSQP